MTLARRLIREQGRTVTWVASKVGVERSYFAHMLSGRFPMPPAVAESLATVLGVPIEMILSDILSPSPAPPRPEAEVAPA